MTKKQCIATHDLKYARQKVVTSTRKDYRAEWEEVVQLLESTKPKPKPKEFLYVGHYTDTQGRYILKIGTTKDLERRKKEHTRNYRQAPDYILPKNEEFIYDWHIKLSKYNTLRFEDKTREAWQNENIGEYVRNDRFCCADKPQRVEVKIRKVYSIPL